MCVCAVNTKIQKQCHSAYGSSFNDDGSDGSFAHINTIKFFNNRTIQWQDDVLFNEIVFRCCCCFFCFWLRLWTLNNQKPQIFKINSFFFCAFHHRIFKHEAVYCVHTAHPTLNPLDFNHSPTTKTGTDRKTCFVGIIVAVAIFGFCCCSYSLDLFLFKLYMYIYTIYISIYPVIVYGWSSFVWFEKYVNCASDGITYTLVWLYERDINGNHNQWEEWHGLFVCLTALSMRITFFFSLLYSEQFWIQKYKLTHSKYGLMGIFVVVAVVIYIVNRGAEDHHTRLNKGVSRFVINDLE